MGARRRLLPRNKVWLIEDEEEEIVLGGLSPAETKSPTGGKWRFVSSFKSECSVFKLTS